MHFLVMLVLLVPLFGALRKGYINGLAWAAFYWVSMPLELRLSLPGALPELTFHRVLVIIFLFANMRRSERKEDKVLCGSLLIYLSVSYGFSWVFSDVKGISFKGTLRFLIETVVFYFMMSRSLKTFDDVKRVLKGVTLGLLTVACATWIEQYTAVNVFERMLGYDNVGSDYSRDITASFRHRILLGYAMAMALPLVAIYLRRANTTKSKWLSFTGICLVAAACYFAHSRGPWLGTVLAVVVLFALGDLKLRRGILMLAAASVLVLVLRPGVWDTIRNLVGDTAEDTLKGKSYNYRWELWGACWKKVSDSPENLVFGYGALSSETMDLSGLLTMGGSTQKLGYTSMDNHYAAYLLEIGVVGLLLIGVIYFKVCKQLYRARSNLSGDEKVINACILSSVIVYLFAMTNVYIFAPQLDFLFWTLIAAGSVLAKKSAAASDLNVQPDGHSETPADSSAI